MILRETERVRGRETEIKIQRRTEKDNETERF